MVKILLSRKRFTLLSFTLFLLVVAYFMCTILITNTIITFSPSHPNLTGKRCKRPRMFIRQETKSKGDDRRDSDDQRISSLRADTKLSEEDISRACAAVQVPNWLQDLVHHWDRFSSYVLYYDAGLSSGWEPQEFEVEGLGSYYNTESVVVNTVDELLDYLEVLQRGPKTIGPPKD